MESWRKTRVELIGGLIFWALPKEDIKEGFFLSDLKDNVRKAFKYEPTSFIALAIKYT